MTPEQIYTYCLEHGRNRELEKIIIKDPRWAYIYARDVIVGRWIEAENIIITSPEQAYGYARDVIKGRFLEAESVIAADSEAAYFYAREIIKGKLPELMHNAMILHGIANENYVTDYLRLINKQTAKRINHDAPRSIQSLSRTRQKC